MAWFAARGTGSMDDIDTPGDGVSAAVAMLGSLLGPGGRLIPTPKYLLMCWEGDTPKVIKPRPPRPDNHRVDLKRFQALVPDLVGGAVACPPPGYPSEGDDVVATAVENCKGKFDVTVVSADKDLLQLAGDARCYDLGHKNVITPSQRFKFTLHRPSHVAVYLALLGDPKDGVDGVSGVGKKGARKMVEDLGDVSLGEAVERLADSLHADKSDEFLSSLNLTLLNREVPGVDLPAPIEFGDMEVLDAHHIYGAGRTVWAKLLGRARFYGDR